METVARVMRELSETIGPRFSASDGEHRAAQLLRDEFAKSGVEVELQRLGFVGWSATSTPTVEILKPTAESIAAAPVVYSAPATDLEGVVARHGTKTLIEGLYEMPTLAVLGADAQPQAFLVINESGAIPLINPRPLYRVPQFVIGKDDADRLLESIDAGVEVRARLNFTSEIDPDAYSYNVIARYRGRPDSAEHIVVCAHYDTQIGSPGAYDNASGTAGMFGVLEHVQREQLPVNVTFIGIAGEEVGMFGSHYFVNDLAERGLLDEVSHCICLDQISGGDFFWLWCTDPTLRELGLRAIQSAGVEELAPVHVDDNKPGADHWAFHERGIPACLLMWWRQAEYHRSNDTFDKADFGRVEVAVKSATGLIDLLAKES
ncbi:peptidase M28-like protein [Tamaricihabitans halophyticus]|uniref:Peptidase M28-like protein n=1 Tax=Tamaricihabitans halophyticus TaxID=1262583 RepID=A0A4V2SV80_9PSEU|nr:M20/M25/M40 family metallo-hydrolase [Tamaricihabitans halophyticus]TCP57476.1 peptidase M28-like protein [Tamaricihabitans halophyticus]